MTKRLLIQSNALMMAWLMFVSSASAANLTLLPPDGFGQAAPSGLYSVDVLTNNELVASALASVDSNYLSFTDPQRVARAIVSNDSNVLESLLSEPLQFGLTTQCGALSPSACLTDRHQSNDAIVLLLDISTFELHLALPAELVPLPENSLLFLPEPNEALGVVANTTLDVRRDPALGIDQLNLDIRSIIGMGRSSLWWHTDLQENDNSTLQELYFHRSDPMTFFSLGYIDPGPGSPTLGSSSMLGMQIGSSINSRIANDNLTSTEISVFSNQTDRVEISRNDQIIDYQLLEVGENILSTSNWPDGSYAVTLRFLANSGRAQETRFFSSASTLPPFRLPQWSVALGNSAPRQLKLSDWHSRIGDPLLDARVAVRMANNASVNARVLASQPESYVELGSTVLSRPIQFSLSASLSNRAAWAVHGRFRSYINRHLRITGSITKALDTRFQSDGEPDAEQNNPITLRENRERAQLNVQYTRSAWSFSGFSHWFGTDNLREEQIWGTTIQSGEFKLGGLSMSFFGNTSVSSKSESILIGLSAFAPVKTIGLTSFRTSLSSVGESVRDSDQRTRFAQTTQAAFDQTTRYNRQSTLSTRTRFDLTPEDTVRSSLSIAQTAPSHQLSASFQDSEDEPRTASGRLRSTLVWSQGHVGLTRSYTESAALFRFTGEPISSAIVHNGSQTSQFGDTRIAVLPTESFSLSNPRLLLRGRTPLAYEDRVTPFSSFPGNVQFFQQNLRANYVFVGRAIGQNGLPMANSQLGSGRAINRTDKNGYFQIETHWGDNLSLYPPDGQSCRVLLTLEATDPPIGEPFISLGDVKCVTDTRTGVVTDQ